MPVISPQRSAPPSLELDQIKLSDRVVMHVARQIVRGDLAPGDTLGSEPELATSFGVSKPVVRESLRDLASLGFIRVRHGKRTVVQDWASWNTLEPLVQQAFRLEGRGAELAAQFADLRLILEVGAVARAARFATPEQRAAISELAARLGEMAAATVDVQEFLAVDRSFHDAIARASGNDVLRQVIENVHAFMSQVWADSVMGADNVAYIAQLHVPIADAIAAADPAAAVAAMTSHLEDTARLYEPAPAAEPREDA